MWGLALAAGAASAAGFALGFARDNNRSARGSATLPGAAAPTPTALGIAPGPLGQPGAVECRYWVAQGSVLAPPMFIQALPAEMFFARDVYEGALVGWFRAQSWKRPAFLLRECGSAVNFPSWLVLDVVQ